MNRNEEKIERRKKRIRSAIKKAANGRMRLSVHRSERGIYAQIIDDKQAKTLVSASSLEKDFNEKGSTIAGATKVGTLIAERALSAGIKEVVFDRGAYLYHGRVKAVAEAARAAGLSF